MKIRPTIIESVAVAGFFVLGLLLRVWHLDREAVEHFDEGIYSSVLWYDGAFEGSYPARELFAPPLLSTMIEAASLLPGVGDFAPFLPAVLLGSLTTIALWLLARAWFGSAAGIFIAAVVSMSDFHVIYSRMALTDVPCLFWIIGSVYFGTLSIQKQSFRDAAVAGFLCGLAWWTKYTGWLPLAIVFSGVGTWWVWVGRKSITVFRVAQLLGVMLLSALLTFAPWWWQLQDVGGYAAVSKNHANYLQSFSMETFNVWSTNLGSQLACQFWNDGAYGGISLGLGLLAAALFRWKAAGRSTGNADSGESGGVGFSGGFPSIMLLIRFFVAAVALTVLALRIWTPLLLTSLALGGFGGMFLWPVLRRSWSRRAAGDLSPTAEGALSLSPSDLESAATIDPALGLCTTLTWFLGMLVATPLYHPYARLFFPLLASVWLAAAGGISWWLESNVSVARRTAGVPAGTVAATPRSWGQQLVTWMLITAVLTSVLRLDEANELGVASFEEIFHASLFTDRTSIVGSARDLADACVLSATGKWVPRAAAAAEGETIRPSAVLKALEIPAPERPTFTVDEREQQRLVVYAYGEPAMLFHLSNAGLTAAPISHLNLRQPDGSEPVVPTFLIIGPNAKRTPGFWEKWFEQENDFEFVTESVYFPSDATLLDLFTPKWLSQHNEATLQKLELYRVK